MPNCELCGEPMPAGEEMFKYHGHSGPCPKPPLLPKILKYPDALHAMQSGVAMEMKLGSTDAEPKHLRTGINSAMCDGAALVKLLVAKGIITMEEYDKAIEEEMNLEVKRYEARLSKMMGGAKVELL